MFENPSDTSEFSPCVQITMPGSLQFSSATYNADEGAGTAAVRIDRVGGSEGATTVFFITSDGTATAGQDYTDTLTPVSFADGETSKTVLVPLTDDNAAEGGETVNLLLTPSDEQLSYEQKYREMTERYAKARAAKDPFEKARLLKEAEDAAGWAKEWGEGARARRVWHLVGAGVGVAVVFVSFVGFLLTFVGRKAGAAPA